MINKDLVKSVFPKELSTFKAVIECYQNIPCNPCETSCPFHAINIGETITNRPVLIENNCVGCGICVSVCPGLVIMLVKEAHHKVQFTIPYELIPVPTVNQVVSLVNRNGEVIGQGMVMSVKSTSKRSLLTIECDKSLLFDFGGIRYE